MRKRCFREVAAEQVGRGDIRGDKAEEVGEDGTRRGVCGAEIHYHTRRGLVELYRFREVSLVDKDSNGGFCMRTSRS